MADTASPRSEAGRAALARFLAAAADAEVVEISALEPLAGGAVQENWGLDARFDSGRLAGAQLLVLRADAATGVPSSLGRLQEFAVLKAAFAAGVTVPEPLFACADDAVFGRPFFAMRRAAGSAAGHRITRDETLDPALPALAGRLGRELATIHKIRPPRPDLGFLPSSEEAAAERQIAGFRAYLDGHPNPRPVLEWGLRWLETHLPPPCETVLCHHDFRTGNYLLDGDRLTGILDWEFAGWGDGHEDIGWFCSKGWRFARLDRQAGGIAERAPFYRGYEEVSGRRIDGGRVFFWEVLASVRWAVIALQQSDRHILGGERSLDLALTGRRATECELELLILLDPEGRPDAAGDETPPAAPAIGDLPGGPALLALARDVLLNDLRPLLPAERRLDALLAATAMAIAEREGAASPEAEIGRELAALYGGTLTHPPLRAGSPLSRIAGEGPERSEGGEGARALLRRFACDLRIGAFENLAPREEAARGILWHMTIARLRLANPRFLAANGLA